MKLLMTSLYVDSRSVDSAINDMSMELMDLRNQLDPAKN